MTTQNIFRQARKDAVRAFLESRKIWGEAFFASSVMEPPPGVARKTNRAQRSITVSIGSPQPKPARPGKTKVSLQGQMAYKGIFKKWKYEESIWFSSMLKYFRFLTGKRRRGSDGKMKGSKQNPRGVWVTARENATREWESLKNTIGM